MSVWDQLVGQQEATAVLRDAARAARGVAGGDPTAHGMTHAWLITGPPGSGRSNLAYAFAAAGIFDALARGILGRRRQIGIEIDRAEVETSSRAWRVDGAASVRGSGLGRIVLLVAGRRARRQAAEALRDRGVPVDELIFEDEGHEFVKLANRRLLGDRVVQFCEEVFDARTG